MVGSEEARLSLIEMARVWTRLAEQQTSAPPGDSYEPVYSNSSRCSLKRTTARNRRPPMKMAPRS
jgi:hypothetical protein